MRVLLGHWVAKDLSVWSSLCVPYGFLYCLLVKFLCSLPHFRPRFQTTQWQLPIANGNTKYVALLVPRYMSCSSLRVETQSCQVVLFLIRMVRGRRKNRLFLRISCWKSAGQLVASCLALHDQKTMRNITLTDSGNASSPNATTFCPRASLPSVEYSLLFSCHRCLVCLTNREAFVVLFR